MSTPQSTALAPVVLAFIAAIFWGVWWIPIRYLESMGLTGALAGIVLNLGAAIAIVIYMLITRQMPLISRRAIAGAALVGIAVSTYSVALTLSDVVRVILLFYLAPAWSKLIEWAFLGQRWRHASTFTLTISLAGALLVLGGDLSTNSIGLGDVLAILSGMSWAVGAALIFTGKKSTALPLTLTALISAIMSAALYAVLKGETGLMTGTTNAISIGLGIGVIYVVPVLALTLWSAQRLAPALLSFLFTLEILSGVVSGALFLDETFNILQMLGGGMIVLAALVEVAVAMRSAGNCGTQDSSEPI